MEKQIEEMAADIRLNMQIQPNPKEHPSHQLARLLVEDGYRKIYDDHQRQCTCYALGCQMAEQLKREVAREIFAEIETYMFYHENIPKTIYKSIDFNIFNKLKKKYTEGGV